MRKLLSFFLICSFVVSCSTSNQVVSNKLFQKRKYQKGWHVNSLKTFKKKKEDEQQDFVSETENLKKDTASENVKTDYSFEQKEEKEVVESQIQKINKTQKNSQLSKNLIKLLSLNKNPGQKEKKKEISIGKSVQPPIKVESKDGIDRSDRTTRILLAILGIVLLFIIFIPPLAILIGIGRGESLRINILFSLLTLGMILVLVFTAILVAAGSSEIILIAIGITTFAAYVTTFVHAIFVIIRGY